MLVFFIKKWNERELWTKSEGKRVNSAISGQNRTLVSVPNRGGTGATYAEENWYRYHSLESVWYRFQTEWYQYH